MRRRKGWIFFTNHIPYQIEESEMQKEMQNMENFYKENFKPEYFCHHDLHKGNLMQKNDKRARGFFWDFFKVLLHRSQKIEYNFRNFLIYLKKF